MCYAGGPYCAKPARAMLNDALAVYKEDPSPENKKEFLEAKMAYWGTREGQNKLKAKMENAEDEVERTSIAMNMDAAKQKRAQAVAAAKARGDKKTNAFDQRDKKKTTTRKTAEPKPLKSKLDRDEYGRSRPSTPHPSVKETAAAIRTDLREQFPDAKFSVTMSRGTGYGYLYVNYEDGPPLADVRDKLLHYQGESYNPYTDIHEPNGSRWGARSVLVSQDISEAKMEETMKRMEYTVDNEPFLRDGSIYTTQQYKTETHQQIARNHLTWLSHHYNAVSPNKFATKKEDDSTS